jgi:prolyl oligopeptidase
MDMLRFHKFTIGWAWVSRLRVSDDPGGVQGDSTPTLRCTTCDRASVSGDAGHDRRPRRPRRAGALVQVQEKASRERPVLIRIETRSGHGASSTAKQIETTADIYAFLFAELGMTPRLPTE